MIHIKNSDDISKMREAGIIVKNTLNHIKSIIKPGVSTKYLDHEAERYILDCGALPSFKGYYGFPATLCVSVNDEIIHGIPSDKVIKNGDIVSVDCGANIHGFHADAARTFSVGNISDEARNLIKVTEDSFFEAMRYVTALNTIGDISYAIQDYVEYNGYFVVKSFTGHGIGRDLHEEPEVPNYGRRGFGVLLREGMAIAIEPMVNIGTEHTRVLNDNWTVVTSDGSLSAHYENTVILTLNGAEIITL